MKRWLPLALKFGLTIGLFWFLLKDMDLADAWARTRELSPVMAVAAVLLMLVQVLLCALRWRAVMKATGEPLPLSKAFELFSIGNFFNLALPGAVGGDAVRVWKAHRAGQGMVAALHGVMLERVVTVFGLVLLTTLTQPLLLARGSALPGAWVFPLLTVAAVAGLGLLCLLDRLPEDWQRFRLMRHLAQLAGDTRRLVLTPRHAAPTLAITLAGHVNLALVTFVLGRGIGIEVGLIDYLVLVPPVILITTLPISIAGWGLREGAMIFAFALVGVDEPHAFALSVLYGLTSTLVGLLGGLFLLTGKDQLREYPS